MIITLITFLLVLGLLVFVHEFGHFITAKRAGIKIEEFGFGFPPRMIGLFKDKQTNKWKAVGPKVKQADSTIYSLNWVPLGGFVKIKGEEGDRAEDIDSFGHKGIGTRIWIISAGVIMNVLLTFVLLSIGFNIGLPQIIEKGEIKGAKVSNEKIQIIEVLTGLPAQKEGLQLGDTIVSIDGNKFSELEEIQNYINNKTGQTITIEVQRGDQTVAKELTPQLIKEINRGGIGVAMVQTGIVSYPWYTAIIKGAETTFTLTKEIIIAFFNLFKDLIISRKVTVDISGPVGIAVLTGQVVKMGFIYILQFAALLSLNLAIINFLPFPALDGGRVLFLLIEKVRGKAVNNKIEAITHNIGFVLLMLLIIAVTYRDIFKFSDKFSSLWHRITNLF